MIKIEHSVVINRDLEDVFKFLITPENNPIWQSGITKSRKTSDGPIRVGSTAIPTNSVGGLMDASDVMELVAKIWPLWRAERH